MKRDMDLLRSILFQVEAMPPYTQNEILIEGHSNEEVCEHIRLAYESGLIEAIVHKTMPVAVVKRLTPAGHDFLESVRSEAAWKRAKDTTIQKTGSLTFEALKAAASYLIQEGLKTLFK